MFIGECSFKYRLHLSTYSYIRARSQDNTGQTRTQNTLTRTLFEARDLSLTLSTFVVCVREPADRTALPNGLVQPNGILCRMKDSPHRCSFPLDSIRATMWLVRHSLGAKRRGQRLDLPHPSFSPLLPIFKSTFLVLTFSSKQRNTPHRSIYTSAFRYISSTSTTSHHEHRELGALLFLY